MTVKKFQHSLKSCILTDVSVTHIRDLKHGHNLPVCVKVPVANT